MITHKSSNSVSYHLGRVSAESSGNQPRSEVLLNCRAFISSFNKYLCNTVHPRIGVNRDWMDVWSQLEGQGGAFPQTGKYWIPPEHLTSQGVKSEETLLEKWHLKAGVVTHTGDASTWRMWGWRSKIRNLKSSSNT